MTGLIVRVFLPRGFAFVRGEDGLDYFLQANELQDAWDGATVREDRRVTFVPAPGGKGGNGLRATRAKIV